MCVSDKGSGGGEAAGGGAAGGPVSPFEELPDGARHAHPEPGPDGVLHSPTSGPRGLPGMTPQHRFLPHSYHLPSLDYVHAHLFWFVSFQAEFLMKNNPLNY